LAHFLGRYTGTVNGPWLEFDRSLHENDEINFFSSVAKGKISFAIEAEKIQVCILLHLDLL